MRGGYRHAFSFLGIEEPNPHRLWVAIFGAFGLVLLALRQQGVVVRAQNPSKLSRPQLRSSFARRIFRQGKKSAAGNTLYIPKGIFAAMAEKTRTKPMRVRFFYAYAENTQG